MLSLLALTDDLEHRIESDPKEKAKISSWVAGVFSDLGLIARIHHEIDIYHPWAATFDHEWGKYRNAVKAELTQQFALYTEVDRNLKGAC